MAYAQGNAAEAYREHKSIGCHHAPRHAGCLGIGLIEKIGFVELCQKKVEHCPQAKILEFLVAISAGLPYLQDHSGSAHLIDQDRPGAKAWPQANWADYSGVSRALSRLRQAEADQLAHRLDQITQPMLAVEVMQALKRTGRLVFEGDLTSRPVSNTSTSYTAVAYGHMSDGLHLGYQAALVSLHSPTHGHSWLSVVVHPGDNFSCTQTEGLVQAAETRRGLRPWRRTDLLGQRLADLEGEGQQLRIQLAESQKTLEGAQIHRLEIEAQLVEQQTRLAHYEREYQEEQRPQRPYSALAQTQPKLGTRQAR